MNYENLKDRLIELKTYMVLIQDDKELDSKIKYTLKAIEIILENLIADK